MMPAKPLPGWLSILLLVGIVLAMGGSLFVWFDWKRRRLQENERLAVHALKTLTVAEVDFRSNDRDGNRINDFWTGDVAGLYYLKDPTGSTLRLIESRLADADPASVTRPSPAIPLHGYWFV